MTTIQIIQYNDYRTPERASSLLTWLLGALMLAMAGVVTDLALTASAGVIALPFVATALGVVLAVLVMEVNDATG